MSIKFNMGEDDRLPLLEATLEDSTGPIDLTGASGIEIFGRKAGGTAVISGSVSVVGSPVNGNVEYEWADGDTHVPGKWYIQHRISNGGKVATVPNVGADDLWIDQFWAGV